MIREIKDAMCVIDQDGRIIWANEEYKAWFSTDGAGTLGTTIDALFPGVATECTLGVVSPYVDRVGKKHYVEIRCDPIYDATGNKLSSAVTFKDVTLMRTLLDISVMAMVLSTPENLLDRAIGAIADVFGYRTIAGLLQKDGTLELAASRGYSPLLRELLARQRISPDERGMAGRSAYFRKPITKEIKAGTVSPALLSESQRLGIRWATTIPIADKDGLLGVLALSTSSQPDSDELGLLQIVCNQISVSLRKATFEEELISARNELELYVDLMGHDITNAIQIALGYLELLQQRSGATKKDYTTCAINALMKINTLIKSVRKIRKVQTQRLESTCLKGAVDDAINEVRCVVEMMDKDVDVRASVDPGIRVRANELIKDMVYNILESVVRRIGNGGTIEIQAVVAGDDCTLTIEDTGPGVEGEEKAMIGPGDVKVLRTGHLGLGLFLVKNILHSYGGSIRVEDRVPGSAEQGNRFVLTLKKSIS